MVHTVFISYFSCIFFHSLVWRVGVTCCCDIICITSILYCRAYENGQKLKVSTDLRPNIPIVMYGRIKGAITQLRKWNWKISNQILAYSGIHLHVFVVCWQCKGYLLELNWSKILCRFHRPILWTSGKPVFYIDYTSIYISACVRTSSW